MTRWVFLLLGLLCLCLFAAIVCLVAAFFIVLAREKKKRPDSPDPTE